MMNWVFQSRHSRVNGNHQERESVLKFAYTNFEKHAYGQLKKYTWVPIKDFDPRPIEYWGSAPKQTETFLKAVKGKGLGVSMLLDDDAKVKKVMVVSFRTAYTWNYSKGHSFQRITRCDCKMREVEIQEISINLLCGIQWDDLGLCLYTEECFRGYQQPHPTRWLKNCCTQSRFQQAQLNGENLRNQLHLKSTWPIIRWVALKWWYASLDL